MRRDHQRDRGLASLTNVMLAMCSVMCAIHRRMGLGSDGDVYCDAVDKYHH